MRITLQYARHGYGIRRQTYLKCESVVNQNVMKHVQLKSISCRQCSDNWISRRN